MAFKVVILAAFLAVANAGYLASPVAAPVAAPVAYAAHAPVAYAAPHAYTTHTIASPAVVSQHANVLRTPGNLGQVSSYSKSISTPFSSVTKHDVRVSNDAIAYAHAPVAYSAPVAYAAPVAKVAAAPVAYAAPVAKVAAAPVAYAAHAAPVAYAAHAAPVAYAAPVAKAGLVGVAYSAAPAVAHMSYSNGYGISYNW